MGPLSDKLDPAQFGKVDHQWLLEPDDSPWKVGIPLGFLEEVAMNPIFQQPHIGLANWGKRKAKEA
jgi:hypothetical protein